MLTASEVRRISYQNNQKLHEIVEKSIRSEAEAGYGSVTIPLNHIINLGDVDVLSNYLFDFGYICRLDNAKIFIKWVS